MFPGLVDWAGVGDETLYSDPSGTGDEGQFTQGSKEQEPGTWTLTGSEPNDKSDITALATRTEKAEGDVFLHVAFTTRGDTGSMNASIELNQDPALWDNGNGGGSRHPDAHRGRPADHLRRQPVRLRPADRDLRLGRQPLRAGQRRGVGLRLAPPRRHPDRRRREGLHGRGAGRRRGGLQRHAPRSRTPVTPSSARRSTSRSPRTDSESSRSTSATFSATTRATSASTSARSGCTRARATVSRRRWRTTSGRARSSARPIAAARSTRRSPPATPAGPYHEGTPADPSSAQADQTLFYAIAITNTGTLAFTPAVTDPKCDSAPLRVAPSETDATFDPGDTWHYACTHVLRSGDSDPFTNTAHLHGQIGGFVIDEQDSTDTTRIPTVPSISIVKTGPATALAGELVSYTLNVTDPGNTSFAEGLVVVADPLCQAPPALVDQERRWVPADARPRRPLDVLVPGPDAAGPDTRRQRRDRPGNRSGWPRRRVDEQCRRRRSLSRIRGPRPCRRRPRRRVARRASAARWRVLRPPTRGPRSRALRSRGSRSG